MNDIELRELKKELVKNMKIEFIPHELKRIKNPNTKRVLTVVKDRK